MILFLVRPHPPAAILAQKCPIPEDYKYNWQPAALKYIACQLLKEFGKSLTIRVWHLMDTDDDEKLREALQLEAPEIVAFSELDILVNEVNRWALHIKKTLPDTWIIVGGKQTSLLREGDKFPFQAVDYALRGDSILSLKKIIRARMESSVPSDCPALVRVDRRGCVMGPIRYDLRSEIAELDGREMQQIPIENHPMEEYLTKHQIHPALLDGHARTAAVLAGTGCPHQCVFCQSPVEYGAESGSVKTRMPESLAAEIAWLMEKHQVNSIFSLEANLNMKNWLQTYNCLEQHGIPGLAVSGFVRAADVLDAYREGILEKLAQKGMRVLSVGLDIPFDSKKDVYRKAFSYKAMMDCLNICENLGILLSATFVGDPAYTYEELKMQLRCLTELPVAAVDIRLAIALRHTVYYQKMLPFMVYHPDHDRRYFDRQNYRYQTITMPGKITPRQTYAAVRAFRRDFLISDAHLDYVRRFAGRFPEAVPFFRRQYKPVIENMGTCPEKLLILAEFLALGEAGR